MPPQRRTILFTGRVQGVGFRATTVHLAQDMALAGTVENLPDGRVQLIVEGPAGDIDALIARLREHFGGFLRTVDQDVSPAAGTFRPGIRIVH